jgi:16S rRNA (cytosine967-C5)-methyltransferase
LAFEQTTKLEDVLRIDEDVVVQDVSSQRVGQYLTTIKNQLAQNISSKPLNVWDCCAASGGKSILAKDTLPAFNLTVTDIRASILQNLKQRFAKAGILQYKMAAADLTGTNELPNDTFQLIVCDAPCSGSGTWGRTPEQLYYFTHEKIDYYASLQHRIVTNAATRLAKGGYFLYITCSVFKAENEKMVAFITQSLKLEHLQSGLISGYAEKGDTMFAALFIA